MCIIFCYYWVADNVTTDFIYMIDYLIYFFINSPSYWDVVFSGLCL